MDERLRFVARLLEGEKMAAVCRQFGISESRQDPTATRNAAYQRSQPTVSALNKLPFLERTILTSTLGAHRRFATRAAPDAVHAVLDRTGS